MPSEGCCGQMAKRRARRAPLAGIPKKNQNPEGGVLIIYLGSRQLEVKGSKSGLTYFVERRHRHFRADPRDVPDLLRSREFMLQSRAVGIIERLLAAVIPR